MSLALAEAPRANTQALSKVFGHLNKLEKVENDIIALLPDMSDDDVLHTRTYAKSMGRSAWRIEIACDAELWNRVHARRGRGNVDTEGVGIKKAVAARAAELGCSPRTIESNAQVHRLVREVEADPENDANVFTILDEKGYWQAAAAASEPKEAVEHFLKSKLDNPMFSVRDAFQWSKGEKEAKKPHISEQQVLAEPATRAFLQGLYDKWKAELTNVPQNAPFISNLLQAQMGQIQWQLDRTPESEAAEVLEAIDEGWQSGHDLFNWLQKRSFFMREPELRTRLAWMCEMERPRATRLREVKQGGRKDNQRGDLTSMYVKYDARTGDAFTASNKNSIYNMGDPE